MQRMAAVAQPSVHLFQNPEDSSSIAYPLTTSILPRRVRQADNVMEESSVRSTSRPWKESSPRIILFV